MNLNFPDRIPEHIDHLLELGEEIFRRYFWYPQEESTTIEEIFATIPEVDQLRSALQKLTAGNIYLVLAAYVMEKGFYATEEFFRIYELLSNSLPILLDLHRGL
jgi:hypothetical protein